MKLLCAGPTSISPEVQKAMGTFLTNPDLDKEYTNFHRNMERKISKLVKTDALSFVMLGEAIMGLEASIASLMEKDDNVLVIYNGVFGKGFEDYVKRYGGNPTLLEFDGTKGIDINKLEDYLKTNSNFKIATLVHCETPSGITNDIEKICQLLNKYNILSIVDSVSAIGGEYINFNKFKVDILIGGTQKCLSAPTGLTTITISKRAIDSIKNRKTPIIGYYLNFKNYFDYGYGDFDFPYTMNENLVYALDKALDLTLSKDFEKIHSEAAKAVRYTLNKSGLELYPKNSFSNTVTTVKAPENLKSKDILEKLKEKDIIISGGFIGDLENTFRIGHMGNNISHDNFKDLFKNLDLVFKELDFKLNSSLYDNYIDYTNDNPYY